MDPSSPGQSLALGQAPLYDKSIDYKTAILEEQKLIKAKLPSIEANSKVYLCLLEAYVRGGQEIADTLMKNKQQSDLKPRYPVPECKQVTSLFTRRRDLKYDNKQAMPNRLNQSAYLEQNQNRLATAISQSTVQLNSSSSGSSKKTLQEMTAFNHCPPSFAQFKSDMPGQTMIRSIKTLLPSCTVLQSIDSNMISAPTMRGEVKVPLSATGRGDTLTNFVSQQPRLQHSEVVGIGLHRSNSIASSDIFSQQAYTESNQTLSRVTHQKRQHRTVRRTASEIQKSFKCFHCEKYYGSEAAAVMHMRKKHAEGTK